MGFTPAAPIAPFWGWTQFTPALPEFYWDVYSAEERIKKICMELHKLCEYVIISKIIEMYDHEENRKIWKLEGFSGTTETTYYVEKTILCFCPCTPTTQSLGSMDTSESPLAKKASKIIAPY